MQKLCSSDKGAYNAVPHGYSPTSAREGAMIAENTYEQGKIAVVYNRGETPPEITITRGKGLVQTVHANGVAIAIVAQARGDGISTNDVVLVERFLQSTP
ncbi:MAG: hypothetical protein ABJL72_20725 [Roseobacter sp.]